MQSYLSLRTQNTYLNNIYKGESNSQKISNTSEEMSRTQGVISVFSRLHMWII